MLAQKSEMVGKAVSVLKKISADEAMRLTPEEAAILAKKKEDN